MLDLDAHALPNYQPPALVRVAAVAELAAELEKMGVTLTPVAYQPGDPVDWSNGRVS